MYRTICNDVQKRENAPGLYPAGSRIAFVKMFFRFPSLMVCLLVLGLAGCQKQPGQEKMAKAKEIVTKGLSSWKSGEDIKSLRSLEEPIEFYDDDWEKSAKLVDFEVKQTFMESDQSARCSVVLKVQYEGEDPKEVQCTYQVVDDPKIKVARDPMS